MSYLLQIDEDEPQPLATIRGWGDVIRWTETLGDCPRLRHLTGHGWSGEVGALADELAAALQAQPPEREDTRIILRGLLRMLEGRRDAEVAGVTDGLS